MTRTIEINIIDLLDLLIGALGILFFYISRYKFNRYSPKNHLIQLERPWEEVRFWMLAANYSITGIIILLWVRLLTFIDK